MIETQNVSNVCVLCEYGMRDVDGVLLGCKTLVNYICIMEECAVFSFWNFIFLCVVVSVCVASSLLVVSSWAIYVHHKRGALVDQTGLGACAWMIPSVYAHTDTLTASEKQSCNTFYHVNIHSRLFVWVCLRMWYVCAVRAMHRRAAR